MFVTRLRSTSKLESSNMKLATVDMVLMLIATVPPLPLLGKDTYFYISGINLLVVH